LEKQVNNLPNNLLLKTYIKSLLTVLIFITSFVVTAQQSDFNQGKEYILEDIQVTGSTNFNPSTVIAFSRLQIGEKIVIPGEQISNAIKKLWDSNLFSSIDFYLAKTDGDKAYLEINLIDLPELNEVTIKGIKKGKIDGLIIENDLTKGTKVTENLVTTTRNYISNKYKKLGYLNAKTTVTTKDLSTDSIEKARVDMLVFIDRGQKVKIEESGYEIQSVKRKG
jgi:outer membrane protein insertion porin family